MTNAFTRKYKMMTDGQTDKKSMFFLYYIDWFAIDVDPFGVPIEFTQTDSLTIGIDQGTGRTVLHRNI